MKTFLHLSVKLLTKFHFFRVITLKKEMLAMLLLFGLGISEASAQTLLYSESFETDGEGTRYTSNTYNFCTNSPTPDPDYFLRTNTNPALPPGTCATGFGSAVSNLQGTYYWASEDIRSNTQPLPGARQPGYIVTAPINVSCYSSLTVSLYLGTASNNNARWESSDSLNIHAGFDWSNVSFGTNVVYTGAAPTVGRFMGNNTFGGNLIIDANLNGAYDAGTEASPICDVANLTKYTFSIPATGSTLRIWLDFDQFGGTEEMAIDLIEVRGVAGTIPTATAPSAQNYCNGILTSAIPLSGTPSGVTFNVSGGTGIGLSNQTGVTSVPAFTPSTGSATISITPVANGCTGTAVTYTANVSNTVGTPFFLAGATTLCAGGASTYTASALNATNITYSIVGGTGATINPTSGQVSAVTGNFTVRATASGTCGPNTTFDRSVTVSQNVGTPSFSAGATTLCPGGTSTYTASASNATSITYSIVGGTGATINPTSGLVSAVTGNFTVRATATGTCGPNTTFDRSVTVNTDPTPVFTLGTSSSRCQGLETISYAATGSPTYSLSNAGTSTINVNTGEVTWAAAFSGTATITATTTGSCPSTASHIVTVSSPPAAPTISSANTSVCAGASVTLTGIGTGATATEYAWFKNGSFVKYSNTSADYTFNAIAGNTNYTLVVIYTPGSCASSLSTSITVTGNVPVAVITPSAIPPYCVGAAPILDATPPTGTGYTYAWFTSCATCTTSLSSSATYVPLISANHRVIVTDANGCSKSSAWLGIILNTLPGANAGLDKSICMGSSASLGTAAASGVSYSWSPSTNLSSDNIAMPILTPTSVGITNYTLTVTNNTTGCSKTDVVITDAIALPPTPTLAGTSSPVCQGSSITLTPSGVTGAVNWYKDGVLISSASTNASRVISTVNSSVENYTIRAKVGTCLSDLSNVIPVEIKAAPTPTLSAAPAIVSNLVSVCNPGQTNGTAQLTANLPSGAPSATSYNWQQVVSGVASNVVPAVNTNSYTASVAITPSTQNNKVFRAQVTYSNGCVKNTSNVTVKLLPASCTRMGHGVDLTEEILTAYPNPIENVLNVSIQNSTASEGQLALYNTLGQVITSRIIYLSNGSSEESLDLSGLSAGVYTLSFQTENGNKIQKIVKE